MFRHSLEHGLVVNNHALAAAAPRKNRAIFQGLLFVGDHEIRIKNKLLAKTVANRTGAERRIEREMFWLRFFIAQARGRTVHAIGLQFFQPGGRWFAGSLRQDQENAIAPLERGLDGITETDA